MNRSLWGLILSCFVVASSTVSCQQKCGDLRIPELWPQSGYYALFQAAGECFYVWIDSAGGIEQIENWLAGTPDADNLGIPGGPIELDSTFNPGYSYRLQPGTVDFGDMWMEVCDAVPCYVEKDPEAWYDNPKTWCPWAARVQTVWNCSSRQGASCGSPVFERKG